MSNSKNELAKKRRGSQNDEPTKKHVKSEPMNMMDLNDDCLEHILKKLNHIDLLNAADTSKRMMQAAQLAFKSKYRKYSVILTNIGGREQMEKTRISVNDFATCLKVVRCFGQSIFKLDLHYFDMSKRQCSELDRYIDKYRAPLLTELTLFRPWMEEPIPKIEKFTFLTHINKCMPNLRALILNVRDKIEFIAAHITHLEYLKVNVRSADRERLHSLKTCLRLNPQLDSLEISGFHIDLHFLRIASECTQLKSLTMLGSNYDFDTNTRSDPILFKNVMKLMASVRFFDALVSSKATISFDQLDKLNIIDGPEWEKSVIRFLSKHPSVSRFKYYFNVDPNEKIPSEIAKVLPSVTEAIFRSSQFSVDVVIDFIDSCKFLKKFVFTLAKRNEYDVLQKLLSKEWRSSIEGGSSYDSENRTFTRNIQVKLEHQTYKSTASLRSNPSEYTNYPFPPWIMEPVQQ